MDERFRAELVELLEPAQLLVVWGDGHESLYAHRELRESCSCARCVDEWSGKALLDPATLPADIRVSSWTPTGRYGMQLQFSDGHGTGIYTFRRLRALCTCGECGTIPADPSDPSR